MRAVSHGCGVKEAGHRRWKTAARQLIARLHRVRVDSKDIVGLSQAEAELRHQSGQGNTAPEASSRSLRQILSANVFTHFNAIVFTGFGILLALGRWQDALFGLPAIFNTLIGVVQEYRAKRTLDRIAILNAPTARVLRDGAEVDVPSADVVLGDVLILRNGDQVTADGRVVATDETGPNGLELDESLLTGESVSIRKHNDDEVLSGSSVVGGTGFIEVTRVGADSYASQLTLEARRFSLVRSELRGSIDRLLKWISWALIPVALVVVYGQVMSHGGWSEFSDGSWRLALVGAIAAVIAMVPLGLVLVTSIAFAVSGVTLAKEQVLIQELAAVEGLARVDAMCVDKTGTLTTGEIIFDAAHPLARIAGWEAVLGRVGDAPDANSTSRCLAAPFATHAARLPAFDGTVPFDSGRKWSAAIVTNPQYGVAPGMWVLGAPEFVLTDTADPVTRDALTQAGQLAESGLRTLLLAHSSEVPTAQSEPSLPMGLQPVALLTFREQVREDAAQTIAYFAEQGVEVRIISGDDPRTVAAVARELGVDVAHGVDARALPDDLTELGEVLEHERVFGRVTPAQKVSIVRALQQRGRTVAMTGDGVNDALAIKEADFGIAMDSAAQATKAVARLVLLDGRFERMPGVVAEGRRVIANIERVSMLFLTKTTYAFAVGVLFGLLAWAFPFLPRQLSITDGLTIGIPAFFLALMPNTTQYRPGFLKRSLSFAVPAGLTVTAALFTLHLVAGRIGEFETIDMQSAATLTLAGVALWVLAVLARPVSVFRVIIVLAMYAGLALIWAIPLSREFFQITWLPHPLGLLVLTIVVVGVVIIEVLRALHLRWIRKQQEAQRHTLSAPQ